MSETAPLRALFLLLAFTFLLYDVSLCISTPILIQTMSFIQYLMCISFTSFVLSHS